MNSFSEGGNCIETLILSNAYLDDGWGEIFAKNIESNIHLKYLDVSNIPIKEEDAKFFFSEKLKLINCENKIMYAVINL